MRKTGYSFKWEKGSKNDNAIKIFKENGISFFFNHFGELEADFYGVGYFQKIGYKESESGNCEICVID